MVHSCCIVGCAQRQNKAKNISLHRIPSFPEEKFTNIPDVSDDVTTDNTKLDSSAL
jgi:hypothetical protein